MHSNRDIAAALRELGLRLEMADVAFKPRAYEKAAAAVEVFGPSVAEIATAEGAKALDAIPGVGKSIAAKIEELVRRGRIGELDELRRAVPVDLLALTSIEGVGAKTVRALYDGLGIRTVDQLEKAARAGEIHRLPHFRERAEQKILHGIELFRQASGRHPLGRVLPLARAIESRLAALPGVSDAAVAGSVRRRKETIGDMDFLVASRAPERVARAFAEMPEVVHVYARGATKTLVRLAEGIDADLRVVPRASFGAALHYFTGSKDHNVALRRIAQERHLKLNEYGLFRGTKRIAGRTEEEVYRALDLPYIPPELRENTGEIEAARDGQLPRLIEPRALRGDLQTHTDWTDGHDSIVAMARAAQRLGLEYLAITDHARDLAMVGGFDETRLRRQRKAIAGAQKQVPDIRLLAGVEVNVRRDGALDIDDRALAELDVVGAGVHSHFGLSRAETTRRLIRAIENPHVDILFHPTCRAFGKREPLDIDLEALFAAAKRSGTLLEIDAQPERLDLPDTEVRRAIAAGVGLVVDSDAHRAADLELAAAFGVSVARRGWAEAADVANTLPAARFLARLKGRRRRSRSRTA